MAPLVLVSCTFGKRMDAMQAQIDLLHAELAAERARADEAQVERATAVASIEGVRGSVEVLDQATQIDRKRLDDLTALVVRERDEQRRGRAATSEWRAWVDGRVVALERRAGVQRLQAPWDEHEDGDATAALIAADIREVRGHLVEGRPSHARTGALAALEEHGGHPDASELRFLVAESWFAESRWTRAAEAFHFVIEAHPETRWAAPSRARLAHCFDALGDPATARVVLEDVVRLHPGTPEAEEAAVKLAAMKAIQ